MERRLIECGTKRAVIYSGLLPKKLSEGLRIATCSGDGMEEVQALVESIFSSVWKETLLSLALPYFVAKRWRLSRHEVSANQPLFFGSKDQKESEEPSLRMLYLLDSWSSINDISTLGITEESRVSPSIILHEQALLNCSQGMIAALHADTRCWVDRKGNFSSGSTVVLDVVADCCV